MVVLKLGLRPWRNGLFQQLFTSLGLSVLCLACGFLIWLHSALSPIVDKLEHDQVLTAYIKPQIPRRDEDRISR